MDTAAIIEALERAPLVVMPLVREVPREVLKRRPAPHKWSAHEHACHLAVVHGLFFDRLQQFLDSPAPVITPYDPGQDDPDDALMKMDLEESLQRYVNDRGRLVARLRTLQQPTGIARPNTANTATTPCSSCSATSHCTISFTRIASRSCS